MEQIFLVQNGDLREVNRALEGGGRVKAIHAVSQAVSAYGYAGGETFDCDRGSYSGDIYAYVVVDLLI